MAAYQFQILIGAALGAGYERAFKGAQAPVEKLGAGIKAVRAPGTWEWPYRPTTDGIGAAFEKAAGQTNQFSRGLDGVRAKIGLLGPAAETVRGSVLGLGSAVTAIGVGAAINGAMAFEAALADVRITAKLTVAELRAVSDRVVAVARTTNQSKDDVLQGFRSLVAAGMDAETAKESLEAIGRAATAAGAPIDDVARAVFQMVTQFKIAPDALGDALDIVAKAGDMGRFELKDMARYLPSIAAQFAMLGMSGREALATFGAAAQVAQLNAAETGEAANNLRNFLAKINSPETLKNFEEYGVNITRVMTKATREGRNKFEAMFEAIDKILARAGGNEDRRNAMIGSLFGDEQAQSFVRAMVLNRSVYREIKDEALKARGAVNEAFAIRVDTTAAKLQAARNAIGDFGTAVGNALLPAVGAIARLLTPVLNWFADVSAGAPTQTAAVLGIATAWRVLGAAVMTNPLGLAISALALGAAYVIDNWQEVKAFFLGLWEPIKPAWESFIGYVTAAYERIRPALQFVGLVPRNASVPNRDNSMGIGDATRAATERGREQMASDGAREAARTIAASGGRVEGSINVRFENAPRGTRVSSDMSGSNAFDLGIYTGYALGAP